MESEKGNEEEMKMPEGWLESKKVLKARGFAPDGIPHDADLYLVDNGLDLMKEMAEALEVEERAYLHANMLGNPVTPILKKFKEWK